MHKLRKNKDIVKIMWTFWLKLKISYTHFFTGYNVLQTGKIDIINYEKEIIKLTISHALNWIY